MECPYDTRKLFMKSCRPSPVYLDYKRNVPLPRVPPEFLVHPGLDFEYCDFPPHYR